MRHSHVRTALTLALAAGVLVGGSAQADRPRKKMIEAIPAIEVGGGVEDMRFKAGLPWAAAKALVYAGVKTSYADFCALSGWSGQFLYQLDRKAALDARFFDPVWGRHLTRGLALLGKRLDTYSWPDADTDAERMLAARGAWEFLLEHIAAGRPVISDFMGGGVFYGYDESPEDPTVYYDSLGPAFGALRRSKFLEIYQRGLSGLAILTPDEPPVDARTLLVGTLASLVVTASEEQLAGCSAGLGAMQALIRDLLTPGREWSSNTDWLTSGLITGQGEQRLCTALYLRRNADLLGEVARPRLLAAAAYFEQARAAWVRQWEASALTDGKKDGRADADRLADAGRMLTVAGHVAQALGYELLALGEVERTLEVVQQEAGVR